MFSSILIEVSCDRGDRIMFNKKLIAIAVVLVLVTGCYALRDKIFSSEIISEVYNKNLTSSGTIIDEKLATIISKPKAVLSSNPYDYIQGNRDFQDIVALGDEALKHMLKNFEISQEDGLKEYVMALACTEILGEDPAYKGWSTGKQWYQAYSCKRGEGDGGVAEQGPLALGDISDEFQYPSTWPKFEILYGDKPLSWVMGDSNFTGKAGGRVGNTCFGMNEEHAHKLEPNMVKAGSELLFKADEIPGLNEPQYKLQILNQDKSYSPYPLNQNKLLAPKEEGEYIFIISVDWGNGNNNILYWFKLKVTME